MSAPVNVNIDAKAQTTPFPHFWEQTFGSGRAILSLRARLSRRPAHGKAGHRLPIQSASTASSRTKSASTIPTAQTKNPGLAAQAANDASIYNFSYVDQIYDGLLANHVRPFVELSFMPKKMASDPAALHAVLVQPQRLAAQGLRALGRHDHGASPSTSSSAMASTKSPPGSSKSGTSPTSTSGSAIPSSPPTSSSTTTPRARSKCLAAPPGRRPVHCAGRLGRALPRPHCKQNNVPVDFVSTHVYANDTANNVFGTDENDSPRHDGLPRRRKGARRDRRLSVPQHPAHLLRIQRQLRQRAQCHRLHLHGPVARQQHPPVRRPHREHGLLGLLRRLRGAGRRPHPVLRRLRPRRRRSTSPSPRSTSSPCCISSATAASPSTPTPHSPPRPQPTAPSPSRSGTTPPPPAPARPTLHAHEPAGPPKTFTLDLEGRLAERAGRSGVWTPTTATSSRPSTPWAVPPSLPATRSRSFAPPASLPRRERLHSGTVRCTSPFLPTVSPLISSSAHTADH